MYAFSYEVPGNEDFYRRINEALGEPPAGLLVHLVAKTGTGLRHFNVWKSREEWEQYRQEAVRPAVAKVLKEAGITEAPEPREEPLDVMGLFARQVHDRQSATAS